MRLLLKFLGGLLALLLLVVVGLFISLPVDSLLNRGKVQTMTNTVIASPASQVNAFVVTPQVADTKKLPAVIMIHEFWGLKPEIVGKAEALAKEGYVVVAPDTFRGQTTSWLAKAIWQTLRTPKENITADLDAVFAWLGQQPNVDPARIMVMGFCYGGGTSLLYSLHNPKVAATGIFYGNVGVDADFSKLSGPVLGIFGEDDASIPLEEVRSFEDKLGQASVPSQVSIYPDKGHAFVKSVEEIASDPVQQQAWQEFLEFARANLQTGL